MDRARVYAVLSDKRKIIYSIGNTELQATKIRDRLIHFGIEDAYVFDNGGNGLTRRKYDKYKLQIPKEV